MIQLKKYWPSIAHILAVVVIFLAPAVQAAIVAHPGYAATLGAIWGILLHWAQSPAASSGSKF